jgi:signal transduction histidine kinase
MLRPGPDVRAVVATRLRLVRPAVAAVRAVLGARRLAEGQAALRRIAAVAAAGAPPEAVFGTVTAEASALLGGALVALTRFEGAGAAAVVLAQTGDHVEVGVRLPVTGETTLARLSRSGRAERMDGYPGGPGTREIQRLGVRAGVSVPVTVDGALWGALGVSSRTGPLPAGTEQRLAMFVEIVAAAAAGVEARESARVLVGEQAALLRVAALVGQGAGEAEIFEAVAVEAAGLVDDEATTLVRYEGDRTFTVLATHRGPALVGTRFTVPAEDAGTLDAMLRTLRPARQDHYDEIAGRSFSNREFGVGSSVSVPVVVDGRLWGALGTLNEGRRLPARTEDRLGKFAELVASALANVAARAELERFGARQAALRRVAELVARAAPLDEVFAAVAAEASTILGGSPATLVRHDGDPATTTTATAVATVGTAGEAAVSVPVVVEGRTWGGLSVSARPGRPPPVDARDRLAEFAELAAAAIASAENKAELRASRARIVATADETRRKVQRDVHDGAQQRLVQTVLTLKLGLDAAARGEDALELMREALHHAERATVELRDIVHGILPASLSRSGLRTGLDSLVTALAVPVDLDLTALPPERLPGGVEVTAYFVVAEALTNVVKHARASRVRVRVAGEADRLVIEVTDDGLGGADRRAGSGLTGLSDRVDALNGTLRLSSAGGAGTTLRVTLPLPARRDDPGAGPARRP